jgi:DMSO/TMAO reductase YedYZ molybdopterin-dependent catalytic subunit
MPTPWHAGSFAHRTKAYWLDGTLLAQPGNEYNPARLQTLEVRTMVTRGFSGRRPPPDAARRLPPGQHLVGDFPVLSAGPTPRVPTDSWTFTVKVGPREVRSWTWSEMLALPQTQLTRDIHCVTTWSKFDTQWSGVLIDDLLDSAEIDPPTEYLLVHSFDGYSTNVPLADLVRGKAMMPGSWLPLHV